MSFRKRQDLSICFPANVFVREDTTLENGSIISSYQDANKDLPDPELFKLKNLLDAGVNLEEVNSKVLGTKKIDAQSVVEHFESKTNTQPSKEN